MLVQLHWQNRSNPEETKFVAQGEFDCQETLDAWLMGLCERRDREMPEGWHPLLCMEESHYFIREVPDEPSSARAE